MKKRVYGSVLVAALLLGIAFVVAGARGQKELGMARDAVARYQSVHVAREDGYRQLFECVSHPTEGAMGMYYIRPDRFDSELDLAEPEGLVYEAQANGRLRLVAVDYAIPAAAGLQSWPATFLGQTLPFKTTVGVHPIDPYYGLRVWLWKDNPSGAFADWNPNLVCPG
jgi:hypothetical protein